MRFATQSHSESSCRRLTSRSANKSRCCYSQHLTLLAKSDSRLPAGGGLSCNMKLRWVPVPAAWHGNAAKLLADSAKRDPPLPRDVPGIGQLSKSRDQLQTAAAEQYAAALPLLSNRTPTLQRRVLEVMPSCGQAEVANLRNCCLGR